ncbi:hypothetical protein GCM10009828_052800 [Actinoplanes couchii]|uniref:Uncharacterized protein n=1 Tax=Actinoplanes couchii TaxID=403638 RepID=A0ABQ3XR21_9ACTN|nr:hypothetical protein Aco03nite_093630 [Actinoplanes couchii]
MDEHGNSLLIDPSSEDPFEHLLLALSMGEYVPLTEKGRATITVFGLNRFPLARARQQAYRVVVLCLRQWRREILEQSTNLADAMLHTIREQPCADVCQAMLRQVEQPGAAIVFADAPDIVDLLRDQTVRRALLLS